MDGRKNNKGTIGNKGGRPPKADEIKLIEKLDNIINSDEAVEMLKDLIKDGNFNALKLYLEYRFGKPKETVHNINENTNELDGLSIEAIRELVRERLGKK